LKQKSTPTFLVAPAVVVVGIVERKDRIAGIMIRVEDARPLSLRDYAIKGRLTGQTGTRMDPVIAVSPSHRTPVLQS